MRIGIVGGALQGMEAAYLAGKAGFTTVVLDRRADAPALSLADEAYVIDVTKEVEKAKKLFRDCDAVLPANENIVTLMTLDRMFPELEVPFMFDMDAYKISSSKVRSNQMMKDLGVSMPADWPGCGFPVIVKPSGQSGSVGVTKAWDQAQLNEGMDRVQSIGDECVIQEFVGGPNISIEVIGDGDMMVTGEITEVVLDDTYDCKMVRSPYDELESQTMKEFIDSSRRMAANMHLRGIMDVEAIVKNGVPKVLEIDARIPSQTPAAILASSGVNLLGMMVDVFVNGRNELPKKKAGAAFYEHIAVEGDVMRSCGEGVFSEVESPSLVRGLFGSDEMITDYAPGKKSWKATIICSGHDETAARRKRSECIHRIMKDNQIARYIDPSPEA